MSSDRAGRSSCPRYGVSYENRARARVSERGATRATRDGRGEPRGRAMMRDMTERGGRTTSQRERLYLAAAAVPTVLPTYAV